MSHSISWASLINNNTSMASVSKLFISVMSLIFDQIWTASVSKVKYESGYRYKKALRMLVGVFTQSLSLVLSQANLASCSLKCECCWFSHLTLNKKENFRNTCSKNVKPFILMCTFSALRLISTSSYGDRHVHLSTWRPDHMQCSLLLTALLESVTD